MSNIQKERYTNIQLTREVHELLKKYCKENGYSIIGLVEKLIKAEIKK